MDVTLQNHNAKHICDVPHGLSELCADISREVIRVEPEDICCFIADYLDTLMITRENAKVAIKVVQSIMLKSELIVEILSGTGLKLEEIAAAAPRLQKAFKAYLEAVEKQTKDCGCVDSEIGDDSEISISRILYQTGASFQEAERAATKIQVHKHALRDLLVHIIHGPVILVDNTKLPYHALFRGHYERMTLSERRGEVQWQRAAATTVEILRKSGVAKSEAMYAATVIQAAYRGYYTRKNLKLARDRQLGAQSVASKEAFDMTAWLEMMFENTGLTIERANKAATIIQRVYRRYREKKTSTKLTITSSSKIPSDHGKQSSISLFVSTPRTSGRKTDTSSISSEDESETKSKVIKFVSEALESDATEQNVDNVDNISKIDEEVEIEESVHEEVKIEEPKKEEEKIESSETIPVPDVGENVEEPNEESDEGEGENQEGEN